LKEVVAPLEKNKKTPLSSMTLGQFAQRKKEIFEKKTLKKIK
jgi:hypothetical protein